MNTDKQRERGLNYTRIVILAVCYILSSQLDFSLHGSNEATLLIWPPSAFVLAFMVLYGYRMWIGAVLGAFVVNLTTDIGLIANISVTLGVAAMGAVGTYLLRQQSFDTDIKRISDVPALFFLGILSPALVSSTIGTTSLLLTGTILPANYSTVLMDWWLGDAMSILILFPLLLKLLKSPMKFRPKWTKIVITHLPFFILAIISALPIFTGWIKATGIAGIFALLPLPVVVWGAHRQAVSGVAISVFGFASVAIISTSAGYGPFISDEYQFSFILFFAYVGLHLLIGLLVATAQTERRELIAQINMRDSLINKYRNNLPDIIIFLNHSNICQHIYATGLEPLPERFCKVKGKTLEEAMAVITNTTTSQALQTEIAVKSNQPVIGQINDEEEDFEYYFHFAEVNDDAHNASTAIFLTKLK